MVIELNEVVSSIKTIEDVKVWAAHHDGKIDAFWDNQFKLNSAQTTTNLDLHVRITKVEKKVMWMAGLAAGLGGIIGPLVGRLF